MAAKYHFIAVFSVKDTISGELDSFITNVMYCTKKEIVIVCDNKMESLNKFLDGKVVSYTIYQESYRNAVEPEEV